MRDIIDYFSLKNPEASFKIHKMHEPKVTKIKLFYCLQVSEPIKFNLAFQY